MKYYDELEKMELCDENGNDGFSMKLRMNEGFDIELYKKIVAKLKEATILFKENKMDKEEFLLIADLAANFYSDALAYMNPLAENCYCDICTDLCTTFAADDREYAKAEFEGTESIDMDTYVRYTKEYLSECFKYSKEEAEEAVNKRKKHFKETRKNGMSPIMVANSIFLGYIKEDK